MYKNGLNKITGTGEQTVEAIKHAIHENHYTALTNSATRSKHITLDEEGMGQYTATINADGATSIYLNCLGTVIDYGYGSVKVKLSVLGLDEFELPWPPEVHDLGAFGITLANGLLTVTAYSEAAIRGYYATETGSAVVVTMPITSATDGLGTVKLEIDCSGEPEGEWGTISIIANYN